MIALGHENRTFHIRILDGSGKVVVDATREAAMQRSDLLKQIEKLETRLAAWWPPHELTTIEKESIRADVTRIVTQVLARDHIIALLNPCFEPGKRLRHPGPEKSGATPFDKTKLREYLRPARFYVKLDYEVPGSDLPWLLGAASMPPRWDNGDPRISARSRRVAHGADAPDGNAAHRSSKRSESGIRPV